MKTLLLGASGFIGLHLTEKMLLSGYRPRVLTRNSTVVSGNNNFLVDIDLVVGDFFNEDDLRFSLKGVDVVVHMISTTTPATSGINPKYDVDTNLLGFIRLLDYCKDSGVKKIIFLSSGGTVYGHPISLPITEDHPTNPICSYGIIKLAIEKYLLINSPQLDCLIYRPANPYGVGQNPWGGVGAVTSFIWKVLNGMEIEIWGDGSIRRDYFYVTDLADAVIRGVENSIESKILNIGSGASYSLLEILDRIAAATGLQPKVVYKPFRPIDVMENYLDISKAKKELDWCPKICLEEGIERAVSWLKNIKSNS
jgi:UDP-glucose 4-epimerase